jgi:hypothetical protein
LSCSIHIVKCGIVSPTLNVNPTLFVVPCKFMGDNRIIVLQSLSLVKQFLIQNSIIYDNISSQVGDKRRHGFGQSMNSSIIHDNSCSLFHRKCHPKHYHSDIKYHMTLIIIFSIATCNQTRQSNFHFFSKKPFNLNGYNLWQPYHHEGILLMVVVT